MYVTEADEGNGRLKDENTILKQAVSEKDATSKKAEEAAKRAEQAEKKLEELEYVLRTADKGLGEREATHEKEVKGLQENLHLREKEIEAVRLDLRQALEQKEDALIRATKLGEEKEYEGAELAGIRARLGTMQEETQAAIATLREKSTLAEELRAELNESREKLLVANQQHTQLCKDYNKYKNKAEKAVAQRDEAIRDLRKKVEILEEGERNVKSVSENSMMEEATSGLLIGGTAKLEQQLREAKDASDALSAMNKSLLSRCKELEKQVSSFHFTPDNLSLSLSMNDLSRATTPSVDGFSNRTINNSPFQSSTPNTPIISDINTSLPDEVPLQHAETLKLRAKVASLQKEIKRYQTQATAGPIQSARSEADQLKDKVNELRNDNLKLRKSMMEMKRKVEELEAEQGAYVLGY